MIYVLILIISIAGGSTGVATHEFNTLEACEDAGKAAKKSIGMFSNAYWSCMPKGAKQ